MNLTHNSISLARFDFRKVFQLTLAVIGGAVLAFGPVRSARAVVLPPTVDQQFIAPEQAGIAVFNGQGWGQTFTVGLPGLLTRIDFELGRNAGAVQPLQIELRKTIGALPDLSPSGLLYGTSIAATNVPVLITTTPFTVSLDLSSAPVAVTPGDHLAVLLTTDEGDWYNWTTGYYPADLYLGGSAVKLSYPNAPDWIEVGGWDSGFQTWVSPVPEPVGLLPAGLLILGLYRRYAKRSGRQA